MSTSPEPPVLPKSESEAISWRSWPLRQPLSAAFAVLGILAAGVLIQLEIASPILVLVALIALALAAWRFFLPFDFLADDGGVKQQWLGRVRYDDWNSFRAFSSLADGFILWPRTDGCPLDAVRSLFLPCSQQQAELAALLRRHLVELPSLGTVHAAICPTSPR